MTSTLNSDGTRSEGMHGATGERGSALNRDLWKEMISKAVEETRNG